MSDIRTLLENLERIDEAQKWDALDAIVNKYAKPGMNMQQLAQMEKEAAAAEPKDAEDKPGIGGFFSKLGAGIKQLASTESFRVKYVLAHAANKLGLPGLYDSQGRHLHYLDDSGEPATAGNANKQEAIKINDAGLLPPSVATSFKLDNKSGAPGVPVDDETSLSPGNPRASTWKNPNVIILSDGSKFHKGNKTSARLARKKLGKLVARYSQLLKKVNESAPVSMRGYLDDYLFESLLLEALNDAETKELQNLYQDLKKLVDSGLIGTTNAQLILRRLAQAPDFIKNPKQPAADPDQGSEDNMDDKANTGDIEPGKSYRPTSDSLEAFAKSGKKGLANDPNEVKAIEELQTILEDQGFAVSVDGKYGPQTIAAVKEFQTILGLKADGDAGPNTIKAILPFKNFMYGEDGGIKEMMDDVAKANELIAKGKGKVAGTPAGAPDSAMMQTQSRDFRDMISLVESLLNEGLSPKEMEELTAIRDRLKDGYEQLNAIGGVPKPFANKILTAINDAGTVSADTDPKELPPEKTKTDLDKEKADAESAKEVAGAIRGAIDQIGTDDPALINAIKTVKSKEQWKAVEKVYPSIADGDNIWDDIKGDVDSYTGTWAAITKHLSSIGVVVPGKVDAKEPEKQPAGVGTAANQDAGKPQGVGGAVDANIPNQSSMAQKVTAKDVTSSGAAKAIDDALGMFNDDEEAIDKVFRNFKSVKDFQQAQREYKQQTGDDLLSTLKSSLSDEEYNDIVNSNLRRLDTVNKIENATDPLDILRYAKELDNIEDYFSPREIAELERLLKQDNKSSKSGDTAAKKDDDSWMPDWLKGLSPF